MLTKKWKIFLYLVGLNISLVLIAIGAWNFGEYQSAYALLLVPIFQIVWLYLLADKLSLPVSGPSEWFPNPNILGWTLVVVGVIITLACYYLLSNYLAKRSTKN